jgi:alpha-methylacyl-CoA racemase
MSVKPLEGVRVLDFTLLPPGAYCTLMLADLGAEIIRVESPAQRGKPSTVFGLTGISRGKRSITLDQRSPRANEVLLRLAASTDVVVENAKPGVMEERGFGYRQAAEVNPGLVWCAITGFGQDGPYADQAGHDLSYMAHSGLLAALATPPWLPQTTLPVPVGALMAAMGVQSALLQRHKTGLGAHVDISLSEAATWLLAGGFGAFSEKPMGIPAGPDRRLYLCADGKLVSVAAAEPKTWGALCQGLNTPDLAEQLHKRETAETTTQRLTEVFATRPAAEWVAILGPMGAAVTAVNHGADIAQDPHVKARGTLVKVDGADVPANPIRLVARDGDRSTTATDSPHAVGQDTEAVLGAAGFSASEIAALQSDGVV